MSNRCIMCLACIAVVILVGCGSDNPVVPTPEPRIELVLSEDAISVGGESSLALQLKDIDTSVVALSLRIDFDPLIVSIDELAGYSMGSFFGPDAIALFQANRGVMYLSIVQLANNEKAVREGSIGIVRLRGSQPGQCMLAVQLDEVRFVNADGNAIAMDQLRATDAMLTVQ